MTNDQPAPRADDDREPTAEETNPPARTPFPHGPDGDPAIPNSGGRAEGHYVEGSALPGDLDPPDIDPEAMAAFQARQRTLLAERSANLDSTDRPHFQRIVADQDPVCGQCGKPFPCPAYLQATEGQDAQVRRVTPEAGTITLEQVASMMDLPVDLVRERLAQQQR